MGAGVTKYGCTVPPVCTVQRTVQRTLFGTFRLSNFLSLHGAAPPSLHRVNRGYGAATLQRYLPYE